MPEKKSEQKRGRWISTIIICLLLVVVSGCFINSISNGRKFLETPYAGVDLQTEPETIPTFSPLGVEHREFAFFVDCRKDFDGFIEAGKGVGTSWIRLNEFFCAKHHYDEEQDRRNKTTWFIPFSYQYGLGLNDEDFTKDWCASTDKDPGKLDHIMDEVLGKIQDLLADTNQPIARIGNNLARADTAIIVTDDFFDDGDFAYENHFFRVCDRFQHLCDNYHVAVLGYPLDYMPLKSNYRNTRNARGWVKRTVFVVVISRTPEGLWDYCDGLLSLSDAPAKGGTIAWNKPQTSFIISNENVQISSPLTKASDDHEQLDLLIDTKVQLVELAAKQPVQKGVLFTDVFHGMEGFYYKKGAEKIDIKLDIKQQPALLGLWAHYGNTVKWEVFCDSIYLLDRNTGKQKEDVEPIRPEFLAEPLSPVKITAFPSTITFTLPTTLLDALAKDNKDDYHYVCRFALRAIYVPENAKDPLKNWAGNSEFVLDSSYNYNSTDLLTFCMDSILQVKNGTNLIYIKPILELRGDQDLYNLMKDMENAGDTSTDPTCKERNTTKTLWLNRLVNYENFIGKSDSPPARWLVCDVLLMR